MATDNRINKRRKLTPAQVAAINQHGQNIADAVAMAKAMHKNQPSTPTEPIVESGQLVAFEYL